MNFNCLELLVVAFTTMLLSFDQDMKTAVDAHARGSFAATFQQNGRAKRPDSKGGSKAERRLILGSKHLLTYEEADNICQRHGGNLVSRGTAIARLENISNLTSDISNHTTMWLRNKNTKTLLDINSGNTSAASKRNKKHWAICLKKSRDFFRLCHAPNETKTVIAKLNQRKEISFCVTGVVELNRLAFVNGTHLRRGETKHGLSIDYNMLLNTKYMITVSIEKIAWKHEGLLNVTLSTKDGQNWLIYTVLVKVQETKHTDKDEEPYLELTESLLVLAVCAIVAVAIVATSLATGLLVSRCSLKGAAKVGDYAKVLRPLSNVTYRQGNVDFDKDYQDLYEVIRPQAAVRDSGTVRNESISTNDGLKSVKTPILSWRRATLLETTQEPVYSVVNKVKFKENVTSKCDSAMAENAPKLPEEPDYASLSCDPSHAINYD